MVRMVRKLPIPFHSLRVRLLNFLCFHPLLFLIRYQLEFALAPTASTFSINGVAIATTTQYHSFFAAGHAISLTLGGFDGWIDDVQLSSVVRAPNRQ